MKKYLTFTYEVTEVHEDVVSDKNKSVVLNYLSIIACACLVLEGLALFFFFFLMIKRWQRVVGQCCMVGIGDFTSLFCVEGMLFVQRFVARLYV